MTPMTFSHVPIALKIPEQNQQKERDMKGNAAVFTTLLSMIGVE